MSRAIGLLSGGLDSMLAVCVLRDQGVEVRALAFTTPFFDALKAEEAARRLGVPLTVQDITEAHLAMLRAPRYGYGSGLNPCIDCHALMLRLAGRLLEEEGCDFIFTGEVLGQRPMSQNRQSLRLVAKLSGYPDLIVRPLSARLLDETPPEIQGKVDRERLLALSGRGRKPQIALAAHYGLTDYPAPAGGCLLTEPNFARRLKDLMALTGWEPSVRRIELLKLGRHLRLEAGVRLIVGRSQAENERLLELYRADEGDWLIDAEELPGPLCLIPGGAPEALKAAAAAACLAYSDLPTGESAEVVLIRAGGREPLAAQAPPRSAFQDMMV